MTTITPDFNEAIQAVQQMMKTKRQQHALFIDGCAGTGKSTLIREIRALCPQAVVAAPTGVAATLLGGTTVHRLFNFPLKPIEPELDRENSFPSAVLRKMKILIVDEVGMLRADIIDGMDYYLRRATRRTSPFGGVPVVFVGDAFQLPPVVRPEEREILMSRLGYRSEFFFDGKAWDQFELRRIELKRIFRQADQNFAALLGRIRTGTATDADIQTLNARCGLPVPESTVVTTTTRAIAEQINVEALRRLPGRLYTAEASVTGEFRPEDAPGERELALKPGCLVMLLNNTDSWSNGTAGVFEGKSGSDLIVRTDDGTKHSVGRHTWDRLRFKWNEQQQQIEQVKVGSFEQYPVRLAHAVTIHKSQGQTFKRVVVDIGTGAFAPGQLYVALSRVTSIDGLYLKRPISRDDCRAHERVKEYFSPKPAAGEQPPLQLYRARDFSLSFVA